MHCIYKFEGSFPPIHSISYTRSMAFDHKVTVRAVMDSRISLRFPNMPIEVPVMNKQHRCVTASEMLNSCDFLSSVVFGVMRISYILLLDFW